jgi:hypothetical protein
MASKSFSRTARGRLARHMSSKRLLANLRSAVLLAYITVILNAVKDLYFVFALSFIFALLIVNCQFSIVN